MMDTQRNTRGILLMLLSMASFAVGDIFIKMSGAFLSPAQTMFILISSGLIIFTVIALAKGEKLNDRRAFAPILLLRYFTEMVGLLGMIMALTNVPLAIVGAVTQASPILVALGSVIFLKEIVGWRRWGSITAGFLGVLLVIKPGEQGLDYSVAWAVIALVAFSSRDLITRLTPPDIASASLATFTMVSAFPFTVIWLLINEEVYVPADFNWLVVTYMVVFGSVGYLLLITSLRVGELSAIMPFRYSRIVFLLILGVLVFGERPSVSMLLGSALIIFSGVYIMWREQLLAKLPDRK